MINNILLKKQYEIEKEKALSFLKLEDGWDGYSAQKIDKYALEKQFEAFDMCLEKELPVPKIIPNSSGLVEISWNNKSLSAYIIYGKDDGYLLCSLGKDGFSYNKEYINEDGLYLDDDFIMNIKNNFSLSKMYNHLSRLEDLNKVKNGWDGKNALAMNKKVYQNAKHFIQSKLIDEYGIFLNYEGEIIIDFFNEGIMKDFEFEIGENVWRIYDNEDEYIFNNSISFLGRVYWLISKTNKNIKGKIL